MIDGRVLMDKARKIKAKHGTMDAADYMQSKGINYDLAMIALIGLTNYRIYYGAPYKRERHY